jgi:hypothetical protein
MFQIGSGPPMNSFHVIVVLPGYQIVLIVVVYLVVQKATSYQHWSPILPRCGEVVQARHWHLKHMQRQQKQTNVEFRGKP